MSLLTNTLLNFFKREKYTIINKTVTIIYKFLYLYKYYIMPRSSNSKNNTNFHYYYIGHNVQNQKYKKYFKTLEDVAEHFSVSKFTINRKIAGLNTKNKMLNSVEVHKCNEMTNTISSSF